MDQDTIAINLIEKENISKLKFPAKEVLKDSEAIQERKNALLRATALGNLQKRKSKIYFESVEGNMLVETTVWATTEKNITLKGGVTIPINCIYQIKSY